ncbi:hypothetical protein [Cryobacterium sp. 1639]|uniref:hypothetical protein n=1 Tax=Cryobacterium inferilacus TaxID=2866629 RepID=UPI0035A8666B
MPPGTDAVGSNIVNVLLILELSALVIPLAVKQRLVRFDLPLMVILSVGLLLVCLNGRISPPPPWTARPASGGGQSPRQWHTQPRDAAMARSL